MDFYNLLNTRIIMPLADKFMGTEKFKYLGMIEEMSTWSADQIRDRHLRELVNHAYQNTIHYREIFDQHGLLPSDIQGVENLSKIPVLTKNDILNAPDKFIQKNISATEHQD